MSRRQVKKSGYMFRAVVSWVIFNAILLFTLAAVVFILGGAGNSLELMTQWYIMVPLLLAVVVSEWVIMLETIAPVVSEWINQTTWVEVDEDGGPKKVVRKQK